MTTVAIIPSAGSGERMGAGRAKQFLELEGRPVLSITLEKFQACPVIDSIILVVPRNDIRYTEKEIVDKYDLDKVEKVVAGGKRRQDSVRFGIEASEGRYETVLIHDGVRPFIENSLIEKAVLTAQNERAVVVAMPANETIKEVNEDGLIVKTINRSRIWMVQTPQVFRFEDIHKAHRRANEEDWKDITDDAMMVERMGIPVKIIPGSEKNIKITTPHDLRIAKYLLEKD